MSEILLLFLRSVLKFSYSDLFCQLHEFTKFYFSMSFLSLLFFCHFNFNIFFPKFLFEKSIYDLVKRTAAQDLKRQKVLVK